MIAYTHAETEVLRKTFTSMEATLRWTGTPIGPNDIFTEDTRHVGDTEWFRIDLTTDD